MSNFRIPEIDRCIFFWKWHRDVWPRDKRNCQSTHLWSQWRIRLGKMVNWLTYWLFVLLLILRPFHQWFKHLLQRYFLKLLWFKKIDLCPISSLSYCLKIVELLVIKSIKICSLKKLRLLPNNFVEKVPWLELSSLNFGIFILGWNWLLLDNHAFY